MIIVRGQKNEKMKLYVEEKKKKERVIGYIVYRVVLGGMPIKAMGKKRRE